MKKSLIAVMVLCGALLGGAGVANTASNYVCTTPTVGGTYNNVVVPASGLYTVTWRYAFQGGLFPGVNNRQMGLKVNGTVITIDSGGNIEYRTITAGGGTTTCNQPTHAWVYGGPTVTQPGSTDRYSVKRRVNEGAGAPELG